MWIELKTDSYNSLFFNFFAGDFPLLESGLFLGAVSESQDYPQIHPETKQVWTYQFNTSQFNVKVV